MGRGLKNEKAYRDAWKKEPAPSMELQKWYEHDPSKFEEFRNRYSAELEANPEAV